MLRTLNGVHDFTIDGVNDAIGAGKHRYLNDQATGTPRLACIDSHHMEKIMKLYPQRITPQRPVLFASLTAAILLIAVVQVHAATREATSSSVAKAPNTTTAQQCLTDLSAFHGQMEKDGYWRGGSGYGYGYPLIGYGYGYGYEGGMGSPTLDSANAPRSSAYWSARPGYEVRTLLASAQILAQRGQQASCEALLGETREIYDRYATEMRSNNMPRYEGSRFRRAQLATAQPVADQNVSYRSDQLIGTEVLDPKGEALGSVDDMVHSPKTGKIAYLVIARGGLFGINRKYVPVPWTEFKATTGAKLLVLDTSKEVMSAAPRVKENQFSSEGDFEKQSHLVDTYWSAHPAK
jgi:sporulation protein YlmC with PRC-barrel domain